MNLKVDYLAIIWYRISEVTLMCVMQLKHIAHETAEKISGVGTQLAGDP